MAHTAGCVRQKPSLSVVHVKYLWISSHNSPLPSSSLPLPSCPLYTPPSLQPFPFPSPLVPSTPLPPPTSFLPLPSCPLPSLSCYDHHCLCNYVHMHIPHPHHHMYVCVYTLMYVCTPRLLLHFSTSMLCPLPALRFEDAVADFSEALQLVPSMACAHINIGLVHLKRFRNPER